MKKITQSLILTALVAFSAGWWFASIHAARTARVYQDALLANIYAHYYTSAVSAEKKGDWKAAAFFYQQALAALDRSASSPFRSIPWTVTFPLRAEILRLLGKQARHVHSTPKNKGWIHAHLARALERAGKTDQAQTEYAKAALLLKLKSADDVRNLVTSGRTDTSGVQPTP